MAKDGPNARSEQSKKKVKVMVSAHNQTKRERKIKRKKERETLHRKREFEETEILETIGNKVFHFLLLLLLIVDPKDFLCVSGNERGKLSRFR